MNKKLGKLEKVELRQAWKKGDDDFVSWLALPENLALLSEAIGDDIQLEPVKIETKIDDSPYRFDILCRDAANSLKDNWVIIECKLGKSHSGNLEQLFYFAAGLDAVTIILIAEKIEEKDKVILDWFNKITNDNFNFFGLEIELWRIENSPAATKFNIVSQPSNWIPDISIQYQEVSKQNGPETGTEVFRNNYWNDFLKYLRENDNNLITIPHKATYRGFQSFPIGVSNFILYAMIKTGYQKITTELYVLDKTKVLFKMLFEKREQIESRIGSKLDWMLLPNKKASRIVLEQNCDPANRDDWENQFLWLKEKLEIFSSVFSEYIKKLEPDIWEDTNDVDDDVDDDS